MRKRVVNASLTIVFAVILSFTCVGGSNIGFLSNFGMNVDAENISAGDVNYPEIVDMTDAYQLILSQGSKEVFEGYPVDENFLMWIDANYGDEVVLDIAYEVFQGNDYGKDRDHGPEDPGVLPEEAALKGQKEHRDHPRPLV